ncbi:MAG TPA: V-type ATP synthase subunit A [Clostridiales bacterium]|nr:V-type ATP synthase subunit A [Clostridiales bacterium]
MSTNEGNIIYINGPVVKGKGMESFKLREMVLVGNHQLIGEVISVNDDIGIIQVYEETEGLSINEKIAGLGQPFSVTLGPGMIGNIFDGIGRPLTRIDEINKDFIPEGIGLLSMDKNAEWKVSFTLSKGDYLKEGMSFAEIQETQLVNHLLMSKPGIEGKIVEIKGNGIYRFGDVLGKVEDHQGNSHELKMYHRWPVRVKRPTKKRLKISKLLLTGQRILDVFFPIAKGGTAAIPGGFGTGKTVTQHQLAKWSDADIIVYIGCGERGNEMADVLNEFPKLVDPKSGRPIMDRTILIANTSNMPIAAREASIYTGITMAEYYRDMGYHVAVMADSTSRWAEALREISGRLEEMPAEEGYPAYLSSRLAEFYERAGYFETLSIKEGSVTIIGAVSPPGGDFSEPVTENTKRYANVFLALDSKLAHAKHFPSINWLNSYSGYLETLSIWYDENVNEEILSNRNKMMSLLQEESKLLDIVQLVGEDVLPDSQRLTLNIARVLKKGFLQQNAFHKEDASVPLDKQSEMLNLIVHLYDKAKKCIDAGIPISSVNNIQLYDEVIRMKYNIPNDNLEGIKLLETKIDSYHDDLIKKYAR